MSSRVVLPVVYVSVTVAVICALEFAKRSTAPQPAIAPLEAPGSARPPLTPPPSPAPAPTPLNPVECPGSLLRFYSSIPVPAAALDEAAMRTILLAGDWLGAPEALRATPLDVAFCPDIPTLLQVERDHGFVHVYGYADSQSVSRTFAPRGGYYHDLRLVALLIAPQVDLRLTISHEISHHVFESTTSARCDPIDEGLAEFTAPWLVFAPELAPADAEISVVTRHRGTSDSNTIE